MSEKEIFDNYIPQEYVAGSVRKIPAWAYEVLKAAQGEEPKYEGPRGTLFLAPAEKKHEF